MIQFSNVLSKIQGKRIAESMRKAGEFVWQILSSSQFHWAIVFFFLFKSNWSIWEHYEWAMGDEAGHYQKGYLAIKDIQGISMAWSPLNSLYFGAFGWIMGNPFLATILHRLFIVLATTLLFFGILRKLIPGLAAMAMTFWWASMPTNISPLYTVHLFAHFANLLPILGFLISKTAGGRGISLALVALSALFLRTEGLACYLFLFVALSVYEIFRYRSGKREGVARLLGAYLIPSLIVFSVWLLLAAQADSGIRGAFAQIKAKSAFNFSQNYGFTYFLQHPETEGNVWYVYRDICEADFGKEQVSVGDAMKVNPGAFLDHVKTNLGGVPASLEIAFFNARHTEANPDVVVTTVRPVGALLGLIFLCLLWLAGGWFVYRDRVYFTETTFRPHFFAWLCFFGFFLQAVPVASLILSRTSFYLTGIAFLYLFTGLCLWAIWRRMPWSISSKGLSSIFGMVLVLAIPSLWANRTPPYDTPRAILAAIDPMREEMGSYAMTLVAAVYQTEEMQQYLDPYERISVKGMEFLLPSLKSGTPLGETLNGKGADYFFVCGQEVEKAPAYINFAETPEQWGWMQLDSGIRGQVQWVLYEKAETQDRNR